MRFIWTIWNYVHICCSLVLQTVTRLYLMVLIIVRFLLFSYFVNAVSFKQFSVVIWDLYHVINQWFSFSCMPNKHSHCQRIFKNFLFIFPSLKSNNTILWQLFPRNILVRLQFSASCRTWFSSTFWLVAFKISW